MSVEPPDWVRAVAIGVAEACKARGFEAHIKYWGRVSGMEHLEIKTESGRNLSSMFIEGRSVSVTLMHGRDKFVVLLDDPDCFEEASGYVFGIWDDLKPLVYPRGPGGVET